MNINPQPSILDNIEIASPCSASWDDMNGNDQVRDCSQCQLSVYNLSAMSRKEAESLINEREGRLCVRLYRRADGTVITDNCPVALRKIRDSFRKAGQLAAAVLSVLLTCSIARAGNENAPGGSSCQPSNSAAAKAKGPGHLMGSILRAKGTQPVPVSQTKTDSLPPKNLLGKIKATPAQAKRGEMTQGLPAPPNVLPETVKFPGVHSQAAPSEPAHSAKKLPTAK